MFIRNLVQVISTGGHAGPRPAKRHFYEIFTKSSDDKVSVLRYF